MRLLITGFGAFGSVVSNPSEVGVLAARSRRFPGAELHAEMLPVDFGAAGRRIRSLVERLHPDAVVCFGVAQGRTAVTPERFAINLDDARIPDNVGTQPLDVPIVPGGPAAYASTLPLRRILDAIGAAGLPAALSESAGSYVCNHVFYLLMDALADDSAAGAPIEGAPIKGAPVGGFVHLPPLSDADAALAVRTVVESVIGAATGAASETVTGAAATAPRD